MNNYEVGQEQSLSLEKSLATLIGILCPRYVNNGPEIFREYGMYHELLNNLSKRHFPLPEIDEEQLFSLDRGDNDQFRWVLALNHFQLLQQQMSTFLSEVYNGAIEYKINSVAILRGESQSEACSLLGFIFKLYMLEQGSASVLVNALEKIPDRSKYQILELIDSSLEKQEVPTGASDTKRRLLDKIDELQEELEYQRVYQEEKDLQIENLNHMVTKLKSNLTEKDLEISSLEKQVVNQRHMEYESLDQEILQQMKSEILRLEKQLTHTSHENADLKLEIASLQSVTRENQQLRTKANMTTKLEQKLEHYKDTITHERAEFQNQLQEKERLIQQVSAKVKSQSESNKELEKKCFVLELDNQKLHQEIEIIKEKSAEAMQVLKKRINEQQSGMDQMQLGIDSQTEDQRRNSLQQISGPGLNLETDLMLALEQQKQLDVQEQMEELQNKHQKQIQVMQEKAKTYEAVIANLKNEVQSVQQQKSDLEQKNKQLAKLANEDQNHQHQVEEMKWMESQLKALREQNEIMKVQYEELKKQQADRRPQLIDFELELLKDLNNGLQMHAKQLKLESNGRKESKSK